MMKMLQKPLMKIALGSAVLFVVSMMSRKIGQKVPRTLGAMLMSLPRPVMMALMAIPEQMVLAKMEPTMPLMMRLMVSLGMYAFHFAWNGMVMKPSRSYNELVWILGTAALAFSCGAKRSTAIALVAADSTMTLALRGL